MANEVWRQVFFFDALGPHLAVLMKVAGSSPRRTAEKGKMQSSVPTQPGQAWAWQIHFNTPSHNIFCVCGHCLVNVFQLCLQILHCITGVPLRQGAWPGQLIHRIDTKTGSLIAQKTLLALHVWQLYVPFSARTVPASIFGST